MQCSSEICNKQPSTSRDKGQGRGETCGHINTIKGQYKWVSAKGMEEESFVDSQHILSLLGESKHPDGSQECCSITGQEWGKEGITA